MSFDDDFEQDPDVAAMQAEMLRMQKAGLLKHPSRPAAKRRKVSARRAEGRNCALLLNVTRSQKDRLLALAVAQGEDMADIAYRMLSDAIKAAATQPAP